MCRSSWVLFLVGFAACAAEIQERALVLSPADPNAPESAPAPISAALVRLPAEEAPTASAPAEEKGQYTCPMHPEVVSDKPGRCPKCNMKLVAKTETKAEPHQHHHGHGQ